MRAKEFTINIPITIAINGDEAPIIKAGKQQSHNTDAKLQNNPVMVSPLQQELELLKAAGGKESPVIDKLTDQDSVGQEPPEKNEIIEKLKALFSKY